jgi:hypothetical protein
MNDSLPVSDAPAAPALPVAGEAPPANPGVAEKAGALERMIDRMVISAHPKIAPYVERIRARYPGVTDIELARKIVRRKAFKNGLVGAVTGMGGFMTLPLAVPADLFASWRIQITMILAVAQAFRTEADPADLKTDVLIVLAGDSAKEALKRVGIEVTRAMTRKAVQKEVSQEIMVKIWGGLGRKVASRIGRKSLTRFDRATPLVGAPIGFAFDWFATKAVGRKAIRYYSGR